jgi:hypothetical protein
MTQGWNWAHHGQFRVVARSEVSLVSDGVEAVALELRLLRFRRGAGESGIMC